MNTYLRCGKQYYFRYIEGIKTPPGLPLASGKAIHAVLEANSLYKMKNGIDMPIEAVLDLAADRHDNAMTDVEDSTKKAIGQDKDASVSIAGLYRRKQAPDIQPVAVEMSFSIDLEPDDFADDYLPVIGFVDSYAAVPDPRPGPSQGQQIMAVEDYKKVSKRKSQLEIDIHPQLTLYDYVYNLQTEGQLTDVIGLRQLGFGGPRSDKPGAYSEPVYRSAHYMEPKRRRARWERVKNQLKEVQRAVKAEVFIATDNPQTCSWCGYKTICQDAPRT